MADSHEHKMRCLARHFIDFGPDLYPIKLRKWFEKQKQMNGKERAVQALNELRQYVMEEKQK